MIIVIVGLSLVACVVLSIGAATYLNYQTSHDADQARFGAGSAPSTELNGFYEGKNFDGLGDDWTGKTFDSATNTGINTFTNESKYKFKVYQAPGLRDNKTVLRLDYNLEGNPLWMRFIKDEMIEVSPGNYLGKVTFKIIPGLPFTATYFELTNI